MESHGHLFVSVSTVGRRAIKKESQFTLDLLLPTCDRIVEARMMELDCMM